MTTFRTEPPPTYYHRCFVMVRSARQFFYHARFEPNQPVADDETYRRLIRQIVSRNPRLGSRPPEERIVIPGFDGLRSFSQAREALLKAKCGGAWQSYVLRSHWRMVFPIWRSQQEAVVRQLKQRLAQGFAPTVHIFRFPRITINHGLLLYGLSESDRAIEFEGYDPNIPDHPVKLIFDRAKRTFTFPPACYWGGGPLNVIEIYRGGFY